MDVLVLALVDVVVQLVPRLAAPTHDRLHGRVFVHRIERLAVRTFDLAKLGLRDDRSAAHRVVGFLADLLVALEALQRHAVHMERQGLVGLPDKRDLFGLQLVLDGHVGHMPLASGSQRAI